MQAVINYSIPTERQNGAPISPSDIAQMRLYQSFNGGAFSLQPTTVNPAQTSVSHTIASHGTYQFKLETILNDGQSSMGPAFEVVANPPKQAIINSVGVVF
jgi:hypothetical protein